MIIVILFFSTVSNLEAFALKASSTSTERTFTEKTPPAEEAIITKELDKNRTFYQTGPVRTITINFPQTTFDTSSYFHWRINDGGAGQDRIYVDFTFPDGAKRTLPLEEIAPDAGIFEIDMVMSPQYGGGYLWADYHYISGTTPKTASTYVLISPTNNVIPVIDENIKWTPVVDTKIHDLGIALNKPEYAERKLIPYDVTNDKVRLIVEVSNSQVIRDIEDKGGKVEASGIGQTQITFPAGKILELGDIDGLESVFAPIPMDQHEFQSEGVSIIQADQLHSWGFTGKNVTVAVLDMGFDVNNEEIKKNVKFSQSFRHSFDGGLLDIIGEGREADHGTAVAEIITDVAPDVGLYLLAIGTEIEFQNALDYILENREKIDIVTMSAGWVNHLTNGKSPITEKLSRVAEVIPTIISAGNYREAHWEGTYDQFSRSTESLSIPVGQNRGNPIWVFLLWDDPSEDYNMILNDESGLQKDISTNRQFNGFPHGLETISYNPIEGGDYTIEISYAGTENPRSTLEIFSTTEQKFRPFVPSGSSAVPTDASGVITVGAVDITSLSSREYSSEGPTNNQKTVPKIVSPDGVSTSAYDGRPFEGTSAAAPHVAGLVALLLEKDPNLSRQQVEDQILNNANKRAVGLSESFNNILGHGLVDGSFLAPVVNPEDKIHEIPHEDNSDKNNTPPENESLIREEENLPIVKELIVPEWIKDQTKWWVNGAIPDNEFVDGIEYLMKKEILVIPELPDSKSTIHNGVPIWIKDNARWWIDSKITDTDFALGLEYLVKEGIIKVN